MDSIFLVMMEASPSAQAVGAEGAAGGFVNAYVATNSAKNAEALAKLELADAGWVLEAVDSIEVLTREVVMRSEGGEISYFDQALVDKVVLVIHTFPPEGAHH